MAARVEALCRRLTAAAAAAMLLSACGERPVTALDDQLALIDRYCTDCHNDSEFVADLSLESVSPEHVAQHPGIWEGVVRKLRGNLMPPPGGPAPEREALGQLVSSLEATLDDLAAKRGPMPGRVTLHRLNRTEYARTIESLLGLRIDADAMLPADVASDGFDNVADVLRVSPTHLDQYIAAARDISLRAIGDPSPEPARADYRSKLENYTQHVHGLPLGTRGGMRIEHDFPADGEYVFNIAVDSPSGTPLRAYPQGWIEYRNTLVMMIDGRRVFEADIGGEEDSRAIDQLQTPAVHAIRSRFRDIRLDIPAGRHEVVVTWVARTLAEGDYLLESFVPGQGVPDVPRVNATEILGPYEPGGLSGRTPSRERVFICRPETAADEPPCATRILANLARQAWRRPVDDTDLAPLLAFYREGAAEAGFEAGIQKGLFAVLSSMNFIFRVEPEREAVAAEPAVYPVADIELAWRLAFFLWSEGPDRALIDLAEAGTLSEPGVLEAQVRRMLADPRARSLVTNFAFQWLDVRGLKQIDPDPRKYPDFDEDLRRAFEREMELFLASILLEGRSVVDLLTARHTFVNDRLARHYGIAGVRTDRFQRVELKDPHRYGLLGKGSVLMVTSYPDRTSPVLRGAWIMEHLLGTPPSSPPPGVETNLTDVAGAKPQSVRERLEQHRTDPSCNHCHGVTDPLGQPLETFNVVGEWRTRERDTGVAVDPTGVLAGSGREVRGPDDLRAALAAEPEQFVQALTEKLMTFALGRKLEHYDMPTVRAIVRRASDDDWRFDAIVQGIIASPAFRMRQLPPDDERADEPMREPATTTASAR